MRRATEGERGSAADQLAQEARLKGEELTAAKAEVLALREETARLVRDRQAAMDEAAAARTASAGARDEHAKDKAFVLAVIGSLKEQLAAERQERAALRAAAERATAAADETVRTERAAHARALEEATASAAAAAQAELRGVCRGIHRQLSAFCDQWVPSGAEAERVDILGRLAELAEAPAGPST